MPVDLYMLCYKNWMIDRLMETQEGREYLDDCKRLRQTKMDFEGLRKLQQMLGK